MKIKENLADLVGRLEMKSKMNGFIFLALEVDWFEMIQKCTADKHILESRQSIVIKLAENLDLDLVLKRETSRDKPQDYEWREDGLELIEYHLKLTNILNRENKKTNIPFKSSLILEEKQIIHQITESLEAGDTKLIEEISSIYKDEPYRSELFTLLSLILKIDKQERTELERDFLRSLINDGLLWCLLLKDMYDKYGSFYDLSFVMVRENWTQNLEGVSIVVFEESYLSLCVEKENEFEKVKYTNETLKYLFKNHFELKEQYVDYCLEYDYPCPKDTNFRFSELIEPSDHESDPLIMESYFEFQGQLEGSSPVMFLLKGKSSVLRKIAERDFFVEFSHVDGEDIAFATNDHYSHDLYNFFKHDLMSLVKIHHFLSKKCLDGENYDE